MVKTQIQLEEWQYEAAKREARAQDRSLADFIREAVEMALRRKAAVGDLRSVAGKYRARDASDLKTHDRIWAEDAR